MSRPPLRKKEAYELIGMLRDGPSWDNTFHPNTNEEYIDRMHLWLDSWIIPKVFKLVPELKGKTLKNGKIVDKEKRT